MKYILTVLLVLFSVAGYANPADGVRDLQTAWAEIKYKMPEKQQEKAFADLVDKAAAYTNQHPGDVDGLIWEGIIRSTYAGAKGGLGALGEAKKAKQLFEQAIDLDPNALHGSAYTSLGSLYYQVPGWPIGFGDNDKAEEMLKKGLSINPDGIDSNYFYGDYLKSEDKYKEALSAFEKALQAPVRHGRELADQGRKKEVESAITEIKKHLEHNTRLGSL